MKAFEAVVKVKDNGQLELPVEFRQHFISGQSIKLIALVAEDVDEEKAWEEMAAREFFLGYSPADSIYDAEVVSDTSLEKSV
jgi:bifunctional DNA-binding transcriptional regulator/antitoxin component of YhaV-PrlF toxin-antitoxin module